MTSTEILDTVMAKLREQGLPAQYYFSFGQAIVKIDGHEYKYPQPEGGREAACAALLVTVLTDLLPPHKVTQVRPLGEHTYSVTRLDRTDGRSEMLLVDSRTFDERQKRRLESDIQRLQAEANERAHEMAAANETLHLLPRIG